MRIAKNVLCNGTNVGKAKGYYEDDKNNLEKYMEATYGGKWNIHDDFDIMDLMQVVLNDIDKKVNSKQKESFIPK